MTTSMNRNGQRAADQNMIDGVQKYLPKLASMTVASQTVTLAEIVKVFQDRLDAANASIAAEAARSAAVKTNRDTGKQTALFVSSLRRIVQGMFSRSPDTLAAFGLKPIKAPKVKVVTKATAQVKSKATRKARNTMGKQQKKAIKGTAPAAASGTTPAPTKPNA